MSESRRDLWIMPTGKTMLIETDASSRAREFLEKLHVNGKNWALPAKWLFRGHADARWDLVPSAFREDSWKDLTQFVDWGLPRASDRREAALLHDFGEALNRAGLTVPCDEQTLRMLDEGGTDSPQWIRDCGDLAALAQHHGLPTRLLDFSEHSFVAAYFAALDPRDPTAKELEVVAIDRRILDVGDRLDGMWLSVIRAPRSSNPNLHAQAGVFVAWTGQSEVLPLDVILERMLSDEIKIVGGHELTGPVLRRFTLPRSEAPELLWLLTHERITGGSMFPGVDGVVRELKEASIHLNWPDYATTIVSDDNEEGAQSP